MAILALGYHRVVQDNAPRSDRRLEATPVSEINGRGGAIVEEPYEEGYLRVATIRDPARNVMGIWQQRRR